MLFGEIGYLNKMVENVKEENDRREILIAIIQILAIMDSKFSKKELAEITEVIQKAVYRVGEE